MDRLSKKHRSWNMSRIRSANTNPEKVVRSQLHAMGYRFRLHRKDLPGNPDIVLPKLGMIVMVHGCFWHRHPSCKHAYTPKSRVRFWKQKFAANVKRDKLVSKELGQLGWSVAVIWECETKDPVALRAKLKRVLRKT